MDVSSSTSRATAPSMVPGPTDDCILATSNSLDTAQAAPPVPSPVVDLTSCPLSAVIDPPAMSGAIAPLPIPCSASSDHAIHNESESGTTVLNCEPSRALSETVHSQDSSQKDAVPLLVDRSADHPVTAQESLTGAKSQVSADSTCNQPSPDHAGPAAISSAVVMAKPKPDSPPRLVVSKEKVAPPLRCMQKAIRNRKEWTAFYKSASGQCLDCPPKVSHAYERPLSPADIYVHQDKSKGVFQIWVWSGDRWTDAQVDTCHPVLSGYHLKLSHNGDPSWVTRKTMITDQGRAKKALAVND